MSRSCPPVRSRLTQLPMTLHERTSGKRRPVLNCFGSEWGHHHCHGYLVLVHTGHPGHRRINRGVALDRHIRCLTALHHGNSDRSVGYGDVGVCVDHRLDTVGYASPVAS
jgi:hypothetical protein